MEKKNKFSRIQLQHAMRKFTGAILQIPPPYSAKKINGTAAYKLARQGKTVTLPPHRLIIHNFKLETYQYPQAVMTVTCSTGTYIRSLIHELGKIMGTGAVMMSLTRTAIGPVTLTKAVTIPELSQKNWRIFLYNPRQLQREILHYYMHHQKELLTT